MKKAILIFVICILAGTGMHAQDIDTLPCGQRVKNYFYPHWHDTSDVYLHPDRYRVSDYTNAFETLGDADLPRVMAYQNYTDTPLRIKGIWALVSQEPYAHGMITPGRIIDSTRQPEYLYLYVRNPKVQVDTVTWDTNRWLLPVAHARWDTTEPKMLCLKKLADGRYGNDYCHIYEAIFDTVYTIQGEFWIGGTQNSNIRGTHSLSNWNYETLPYYPTIYLYFGWRDASGPYDHYTFTPTGIGPEGPFYAGDVGSPASYYGPFGIITDGQHFVQLSSADTAQGEALYTAFYPDSTYQTITAVPNHGFLFSHWNDSVTDNPRTVFVTQDTAFTAYFRPAPLHSVTVRSSNEALGYTTGDSTYYEGDQAVVRAVPLANGIRFLHWNDSVTDNPRTITVTQDTSFTAYFASPQGIVAPDPQLSTLNPQFSISPNPARGSVTVTIPSLEGYGEAGGYAPQLSIVLSDAAGRELLTLPVTSRKTTIPLDKYPSGTYFLTLRTPSASSTQRLVLEN